MISQFRWLLAFGLITLLTACAAEPVEPTVSEPAAPATPEIEQPTAPQVAAVPAPPTVPFIDVPDPAEIVGWSPNKVADTLGPATLVRRERGAEIWQYRTDACVLFVFLYPGPSGQSVRHLDTGDGIAADTCITAVVRANASG